MLIISFTLIFLFFPACAQHNQSAESVLPKYFREIQRKSYPLPKELREISGLAMTPDGRLFAHDDEKSIIYQIDYNSGEILKEFQVGDKKIKQDFEGITVVDQNIFLVSSSGDLYRFNEGQNGDKVEFSRFETDLSAKYDVEGLCYDPQTEDLLLACKGYAGKGFKDKKAVYAVSSKTLKMIPDPRFLIKESDIVSEDRYSLLRKIGSFFLLPTQKSFSPSGIARHPRTGSYFILSADDPFLTELSSAGLILGVVHLDASLHKQPEGIEFAPDLSLIIADEGGNSDGYISIYKYKNSE